MEKILKTLLIGFNLVCFVFVMGAPLAAMHYEGGGYDLWLVPNSGSSVDLNPSGPIHLQDIKGYPFGLFYGDQLVTGLGVLVETAAPTGEPAGLDEGAVILTISRDGGAIKVAWEINTTDYPSLLGTEPVDIFYQVGTGKGDYNNAGFTANKIIDNNAIAGGLPAEISSRVSLVGGEKAFKWNDQVGGGYPEIYFKGCIAGLATDTTLGVKDAVAVGKIDLALGAGVNVVSSPLFRADNSISQFFQTDLLTSGDYLYFKPLSESPNTEKATIVSGAWKDSLGADSNISVLPEYGYWIVTQNSKNLTTWGKVLRTDNQTIVIKDNGILVMGTVYPKQTIFIDAGLTATGGAKTGDAVYYKPLAGSPNTQKVTFDGTDWSEPTADKTFTLPYGYWYKRKAGNGDLTYLRLRPWSL